MCAALRRGQSSPHRRRQRTEPQANLEGARAGKAARFVKCHVPRNSGGALVIRGTGALVVAASSFKRINSKRRSESSTICISGIAATAGIWLCAIVLLGQASGSTGVPSCCSETPRQSQAWHSLIDTQQHTDAGTMSASRTSEIICQKRFMDEAASSFVEVGGWSRPYCAVLGHVKTFNSRFQNRIRSISSNVMLSAVRS